MKNGFILPVVFFIAAYAYQLKAQPYFIEWQKSFGGSNYDFANDVKQLTDGGYIVAGYSLSDDGDVSLNYGHQDYWVIRLGVTGDLIWERTYGGSEGDQAYSIEPTPDGGYIIAGSTFSNDIDVSGNHGGHDMWVLKLTSDGDISWKKTYGGSLNEVAYDIIPTSEGGYIIAGSTSSTNGDVTENNGNNDAWIVKLTPTGSIQWQKSFGGTFNELAFAVYQTTDGGYIIGADAGSDDGDVTGFQGIVDFWLLKLDQDGNLIWQKTMGGSEGEEARSILQTPDGGYFIGGWTASDDGDVIGSNGKTDIWVVKTDMNGNIMWQRSLGTSSEEFGASVNRTNDGGYIVSGSMMPFYDTLEQECDYWVVKLNSMGETEWQQSYGGSKNDFSLAIQQTMDDRFIITGFSESNDGDVSGNHGSADIWVAKLGDGIPGQLTVSIQDTTIVTESNIYVYAMVTLSGPSNEVVKVNYKTKNGTAIKGSDYVATSGTLRFLPGQTSRHIRVSIKADVVPEQDEYFLIKLSDPVNAELLNDEGLIIITESEVEQNAFAVSLPQETYRHMMNGSSEPVIPNPQSRHSAFHVLNSGSLDFDVLLMDEGGKVLLNRKRYANDWQLKELNTGLYLYLIRYKNEDGAQIEISGKIFVTD